jgi:hypothetical protein
MDIAYHSHNDGTATFQVARQLALAKRRGTAACFGKAAETNLQAAAVDPSSVHKQSVLWHVC